jgi:hypothetical protein
MPREDPYFEYVAKPAFVNVLFATSLHVSGNHLKIVTCALKDFLTQNSLNVFSFESCGRLADGRPVAANAIHSTLSRMHVGRIRWNFSNR